MRKPLLKKLLSSLLTPTFSGMGKLTRWIWTLNGMSYGTIPEIELSGDFTINASAIWTGGDDYIFSGNLDFIRVLPDGRVVTSINSAFLFHNVGIILNERFNITVRRVGLTLTVETDTHTTVNSLNSLTTLKLSVVGNNYVLNRWWDGAVYGLSAEGISNTGIWATGTFNYELNKPYSDPYFFTDSDNSIVMSTFNVLAEDVTEGSL